MLLAGVTTFIEYIAVALAWGLPFAVIAALPLIALTKRLADTRTRFVATLFAGFVGAVVGYAIARRLYWQAHGSTGAIVYFLSGIIAGGLCGILAISFAWRLSAFARGKLDKGKGKDGNGAD